MLITKRDGTQQAFDRNKIKKSILASFEAVSENSISEVDTVTDSIVACICRDTPTTVSGVQACTERILLEYGYMEAAAAFMEYRINRDMIRDSRLTPDPSALQDYIHQAKYARWNLEEGRRENYSETVDRVIEMHYSQFCGLDRSDKVSNHFPDPEVYDANAPAVYEEITNAFRSVYTKGVLPSMRSMQFAGPALESNNARMYNCCFTHIDRVDAFPEALFLLLSGCGVGYSVQWQHVDMLPVISGVTERAVIHYTIDDSIRGWASALAVLVKSYTASSGPGPMYEFDYSSIRGEGAPLKTSGGLAPGHLGLKAMLEEVRSVLDGAVGRKLRPIEAHDIMCYTARAVLSGGIRRSSMIALFSSHDTEMMYAKSRGVFDPMGMNDQRSMANNSCVLLRSSYDRSIFDRVVSLAATGYGEPGFVFLDDPNDGINPCGEIIMNPRLVGEPVAGFAFCNLVEINAADCGSIGEFLHRCDAAAVIATLQSCYTTFPFLDPRSCSVAKRDRSIGVGITGIMDNPVVLDWLAAGRVVVERANKKMAGLLEINSSERFCCVKPSGTASLLLGTSSGVHCHHSRRYLRRVTCNRTEVIARAFAAANPHMVEAKPNGDYCLVFPVQARDDALVGITGTDFLEVVMKVLRDWCGGGGHNVSCTVPVGDGELADVVDMIWDHRSRITGMAFAPLDISKRYPFAPLEAVDDAVLEAYWALLIGEYTPVDWECIGETADGTDPSKVSACDSGKCLMTGSGNSILI